MKPEQRSRDVGTKLLKAVFEHARQAGLVAIELEVATGHSRVASLYQRFGFCQLDRSRWVKELILRAAPAA